MGAQSLQAGLTQGLWEGAATTPALVERSQGLLELHEQLLLPTPGQLIADLKEELQGAALA